MLRAPRGWCNLVGGRFANVSQAMGDLHDALPPAVRERLLGRMAYLVHLKAFVVHSLSTSPLRTPLRSVSALRSPGIGGSAAVRGHDRCRSPPRGRRAIPVCRVAGTSLVCVEPDDFTVNRRGSLTDVDYIFYTIPIDARHASTAGRPGRASHRSPLGPRTTPV